MWFDDVRTCNVVWKLDTLFCGLQTCNAVWMTRTCNVVWVAKKFAFVVKLNCGLGDLNLSWMNLDSQVFETTLFSTSVMTP